MIVPILSWNSIAENALRFAITLSREIEVLHIESQDSPNSLKQIWPLRVEQPAREANQAIPRLGVLKSTFSIRGAADPRSCPGDRAKQPGSYCRDAAAGAGRTSMYQYFLTTGAPEFSQLACCCRARIES